MTMYTIAADPSGPTAGVCSQERVGTVDSMRIEHERRFIVKPTWRPTGTGKSIQQGWLEANELCETRVRVLNDDASVACKIRLEETGKRIEMETDVDLKTAATLLSQCRHALRKTRYEVIIKDVVWEVDVYLGDLTGLCTAEVENPPVELVLPGWVDREVTGEGGWSNAELARFGVPKG